MRYTAPITTPTPAPGRTPANRLNLDWAGTGKNHTKLPEGTTVNVSLVLAPEYYVGVDGATDWEALEDGAYFTTQVTIDNTDPEIPPGGLFRTAS